jgi:predicted Zn-dependent protease with MMP-like domain
MQPVMADQDPELETVERIYDALEGGDPETALRLAREALGQDSDDPVVRFLAGLACLDLDRTGEAILELQSAVKLDGDDAEFRTQLGYALYRGCRFDEAYEQTSRALELDDSGPDAHYTAGLLAERRGEYAEAEGCFARAHRIDAENFPLPVRFDDATFRQTLDAAREFLSEAFRKHLDDVTVSVDDLPAEDVLRETAPPMDPELLGLFVGVPRSEATSFSPGGEMPPQILLFKRNLERIYPDAEMLREEIGRTLHHELGHYLGLDEDELEAIDLH